MERTSPIGKHWIAMAAAVMFATVSAAVTAQDAAKAPAAQSPAAPAPASPAAPAAESPAAPAAESPAAPAADSSPVDLTITGPKEAKVGDEVTFEFVIANRGASPLTKMTVTDRFEPGLRHARSEKQVERDLDDLAPGQSHRITIALRVVQPGTVGHTIEVVSNEKIIATTRATLTAAAAPEPEKPGSGVSAGDPSKPGTSSSAESGEKPSAMKSASGLAFPGRSEQVRPQPAREEEIPLGPPLVESREKLAPLDPEQPVWIDKEGKRVILVAAVCQRQVPLELFACVKNSKEHESILAVPTKASTVHTALLAVGAEAGSPVQFRPIYQPARGTEIEVTLVWNDEKGQRKTARGQEWVRDVKTGKAMEHPWVFAGSRFIEIGEPPKKVYHADREGDLICVSNFPSAVLDLPIPSTASDTDLMFEAYTERIPPRGTHVTVILAPKLKPGEIAKPALAEPAKAEKPPVDQPQPNLAPPSVEPKLPKQ